MAGSARYFEYDLENRLLKKRPAPTGAADLTLVYDAEGRLAKYSTDDGTTYTSFVYDGVNLIAEYNNAGTLTNTYVHGTGTDEPLVWFNGSAYGSSIKRYFVSNYQGSIIAYTNDSGVRQATYKYDAYGRPMNASNAEDWSGARFRYTGQTMLYEARLYYYKARVYDPVYGHFMQTDPIGSKDDLDLYAYVGGDPVNGTDPSGTEIKMSRSGNNVRFVVYNVYRRVDGKLVEPELAAKINNAISKRWTGKFGHYNVVTVAMSPPAKTPSKYIQDITVLPGDGRSNTKPGGYSGGHTGTWFEGANPNDWAHEFGHEGGLWDGYTDLGPINDYFKNDIMGISSSLPIQEDDITAILNGGAKAKDHTKGTGWRPLIGQIWTVPPPCRDLRLPEQGGCKK